MIYICLEHVAENIDIVVVAIMYKNYSPSRVMYLILTSLLINYRDFHRLQIKSVCLNYNELIIMLIWRANVFYSISQ